MILSRDEMPRGPIEIDLSGPQGNAFYLMGLAKTLCKELKIEVKDLEWMHTLGITKASTPADWILEQMKSGDYENLLSVFDSYFGEHVILYR